MNYELNKDNKKAELQLFKLTGLHLRLQVMQE